MLRELTLKEKNQFIDKTVKNPNDYLCCMLDYWVSKFIFKQKICLSDEETEIVFPEFYYALNFIRDNNDLKEIFKTLDLTECAVWHSGDTEPKQEFLLNLKAIINNPE